jgi:hypothetical protein
MLFGSFAGKAAVNLCRDTNHEPARIGAFRQRLGDRLAGCSQIGEHVTHDIGEARERFTLGGREPSMVTSSRRLLDAHWICLRNAEYAEWSAGAYPAAKGSHRPDQGTGG